MIHALLIPTSIVRTHAQSGHKNDSPVWVATDTTKLVSEQPQLAEQRTASKQARENEKRSCKRKKGIETGVFSIPLLLAYSSQ
jgi:hypothetical protein